MMEEAPQKLTRKTPEEIEQLVQDIVGNRVFGSWQIPPSEERMLASIFMPLLFLQDGEILKETAHLYAPLEDAGPRSVNGYPCFFSMTLIGHEDWRIVATRVRAIMQQVETISKGRDVGP